jgi:hypothetical protein
MTSNRREQRQRDLKNTLARTLAQRDGCLANLVRYETRLAKLRKQMARLERAMARPATATPEPVKQTAAPAPAPTNVSPTPKPVTVEPPAAGMAPATKPPEDLDELPTFLRRSNGGTAKVEAEKPATSDEDAAIRREADIRWRNWVPGKNAKGETKLTRPRISTFVKEVRDERRKAAKAKPVRPGDSVDKRKMPLTGRAALAMIRATE